MHTNIYDPDYVVVVDETLLEAVDVTAGLSTQGGILVNTPKRAEEILPHLRGYEGPVYTVDAYRISMESLGKYFPNSPMLGAIVAVTGLMDEGQFFSEMRKLFQHKFAKRPEMVEGNMQALETAYKEVGAHV